MLGLMKVISQSPTLRVEDHDPVVRGHTMSRVHVIACIHFCVISYVLVTNQPGGARASGPLGVVQSRLSGAGAL